jgi:hypothetical protein
MLPPWERRPLNDRSAAFAPLQRPTFQAAIRTLTRLSSCMNRHKNKCRTPSISTHRAASPNKVQPLSYRPPKRFTQSSSECRIIARTSTAVHSQSELNFGTKGASEAGYKSWLAGRQLAVEEVAKRMNLPLGHEVEVWFNGRYSLARAPAAAARFALH